MNPSAVGHTRLVIVGATGMVRKLGISHPKLDEVQHSDFADCSDYTIESARVLRGSSPAQLSR
jgi:hypothetical protein